MSLVGDNIARAMEAGIRAVQLSALVHCDPSHRAAIRAWLLDHEPEKALALTRELEIRWAEKDRLWSERGE